MLGTQNSLNDGAIGVIFAATWIHKVQINERLVKTGRSPTLVLGPTSGRLEEQSGSLPF